jgi:YD repeat-containing protein
MNRLWKVEQCANTAIPCTDWRLMAEYSYDKEGNLLTAKDAGGLITNYRYDDRGRLLRVVSPDSGTQLFWYGDGDQLVEHWPAAGASKAYAYDARGRRTSMSYSGGGGDPPTTLLTTPTRPS